MSKWHGGKGSQTRPVDPKRFSDNFDRIFRKKADDQKTDPKPEQGK